MQRRHWIFERQLARAAFSLLVLASELFTAEVGRGVEVPPGFIAETLATNLNAATAVAPSPDGRIFIADQTGRLLIWKNGRVLDTPALTLHVTDYWERGLIGLALDPEFPRVPQVFLLYVTDRPFVHHVLARFTCDGDRIDPGSETILLEGDDQAKLGGGVPAGHQGGALRFGLDGKLYASLGEQTAGEPAQRLDTLQGKLLRVNRDGSIPDDNPFLAQTTGKYRAIFARGVRNSFGLAVQPRADGGRMFFTDVGGSAFEEINELKSGANYGWPRAEGFSTNAAWVNPLHAYPPLVGQSIVGGVFVPRGVESLNGEKVKSGSESASRRLNDSTIQRFNDSTARSTSPPAFPPRWRGKFLFADFMKHWIKALDPDAPTNVVTFARGLNGPVATEWAPDGSLLVLNRGAVWRDPKKFVPNAGSLVRIRFVGDAMTNASPRTTSIAAALGLPAESAALPRQIRRDDWERRLVRETRWPIWRNHRAWHHGVDETVGLFLPTNGAVKFSARGRDVELPPGAVVVREFHLHETAPTNTANVPSGGRRIETRLLIVGAPRGYGASYRWKSPERAELIEDGELDVFENVFSPRPNSRGGGSSNLTWWFPGLDEGSPWPANNPAYWISLDASDLVGAAANSPGQTLNTLSALHRAGKLETSLDAEAIAASRPGIAWADSSAGAEARVRSYLHGNCAVCHQPGGASRGNFDARLSTPLAGTGLIHGEPVAGDLGLASAKLVVPGSPERSILYQRLARTDFFRMPPVQYHSELSPILPVLAEWIRSLLK